MRNGIILVIGLLILGVGFTSTNLFKADVESADTGTEHHISGLSAAEIEGIQFMREEEKLVFWIAPDPKAKRHPEDRNRSYLSHGRLRR